MSQTKLLNIIIYSIITILSFPTIAILATWNTLPGQKLYPIKKGLEKIAAIIVSPSYAARSELELQLLERRIAENEKLFADLSTAGLGELTAQAYSARELILLRKKNTNQETIKQFVAKLKQANTKLETQKRQLASNPPTTPNYITQTEIIRETRTETIIKEVPIHTTPPPQPQPQVIIDEIEDTQEEIENIIDQLEEEVDEPEPIPSPTPTLPSPTPPPSPAPTSSPTSSSCQDLCQNLGYNTGNCKNNPQSCANGTHLPSGDAYCSTDKPTCCCQNN